MATLITIIETYGVMRGLRKSTGGFFIHNFPGISSRRNIEVWFINTPDDAYNLWGDWVEAGEAAVGV